MKKSEFVSLVLALISGVALGLWYKTLDGLANNVDVRTVAVFLSITLFWKIFETAYCLIKEINKEELSVRLIFFTSVMVLMQCIIYLQTGVKANRMIAVLVAVCIVITAISGGMAGFAWRCKRK